MKAWNRWLVGALNAFISGAASAIAGFAVGVGWKHAFQIAGFAAFVSFSKWMGQHPLPGAGDGGDNSGMIQAQTQVMGSKPNTGGKS